MLFPYNFEPIQIIRFCISLSPLSRDLIVQAKKGPYYPFNPFFVYHLGNPLRNPTGEVFLNTLFFLQQLFIVIDNYYLEFLFHCHVSYSKTYNYPFSILI